MRSGARPDPRRGRGPAMLWKNAGLQRHLGGSDRRRTSSCVGPAQRTQSAAVGSAALAGVPSGQAPLTPTGKRSPLAPAHRARRADGRFELDPPIPVDAAPSMLAWIATNTFSDASSRRGGSPF